MKPYDHNDAKKVLLDEYLKDPYSDYSIKLKSRLYLWCSLLLVNTVFPLDLSKSSAFNFEFLDCAPDPSTILLIPSLFFAISFLFAASIELYVWLTRPVEANLVYTYRHVEELKKSVASIQSNFEKAIAIAETIPQHIEQSHQPGSIFEASEFKQNNLGDQLNALQALSTTNTVSNDLSGTLHPIEEFQRQLKPYRAVLLGSNILMLIRVCIIEYLVPVIFSLTIIGFAFYTTTNSSIFHPSCQTGIIPVTNQSNEPESIPRQQDHL